MAGAPPSNGHCISRSEPCSVTPDFGRCSKEAAAEPRRHAAQGPPKAPRGSPSQFRGRRPPVAGTTFFVLKKMLFPRHSGARSADRGRGGVRVLIDTGRDDMPCVR